MKKISLFALAFGTSLTMFAQSQQRLATPMNNTSRFGIKGGVSLGDLKFKDVDNAPSTEKKTNFDAGFFADIPMGTAISFAPELIYSGQGARINVKSNVGTTTTTTSYSQQLNYINLPLLFKAKTPGGFFVETGPQAGYLITAKATDMSANGSDISGETDNKDAFKKFDVAWVGGIGYMSRMGLGIDARYNSGLTKAYNNGDNSTTTSSGKLRNRVIQIGLFYAFGAGK